MPDATPERSVVGKMTRCPERDVKPLSTAEESECTNNEVLA